jgi:biopolymer transport protein ExbD
MRLVATLLVLALPLAACSKKHPGPPPRCVVKVQLPTPHIDGTKAPACSIALIAPDATSYADVIAGMDAAAKAGFVDFGIGTVTSKLAAPAEKSLASRTTSEGMIIGRFEGIESAPGIVFTKSGDVMVGGNVVGKADDAALTDAIAAVLAKPPADKPAVVIITAPASQTYAAVLRAAKAADKIGYQGFLFSLQN